MCACRCVCACRSVCACRCVHVSAVPAKAGHTGSPGARLTPTVDSLMWMLGSKLRSSARAIGSSDHWTPLLPLGESFYTTENLDNEIYSLFFELWKKMIVFWPVTMNSQQPKNRRQIWLWCWIIGELPSHSRGQGNFQYIFFKKTTNEAKPTLPQLFVFVESFVNKYYDTYAVGNILPFPSPYFLVLKPEVFPCERCMEHLSKPFPSSLSTIVTIFLVWSFAGV